ncbi:salicylate synthase [Micromonospora echinospora]
MSDRAGAGADGTPQRYLHASVTVARDPVAAGVDLVHRARGPLVVYERPGEVAVASGVLAEIVLDRRQVQVRIGEHRHVEPTGDEPLQQVHRLLAGLDVAGWRAYGWIGFELSYLLHGMPEAVGPAPLLHLVVPRREARISNRTAHLRATDRAGLADLSARLSAVPEQPPHHADGRAVDESSGSVEYRAAVASAIREIRGGDLQKVILSRVVPVPGPVDLVATYRTGRRRNTPARSFLLRIGGVQAAGFSPETVIEVGADGTISTQPLAGTRALSGLDTVDEELRAELLGDPKEIFEHAISVHAAQEELRGVCRDGSVHIEEFLTVQRRGSVQHLASRVTGRLDAGRNCWHAAAALFPAITASGIPKRAACAAIHRYETTPRGLYSGAVVVADSDGGLDAALVLRTVFQQDGRTWLRAGAGIVAQSTPERELEETREKLRSVSPFLVGTDEPVPVAGGEVA